MQFTDYKVEPDGDQQVDLVNASSCDKKRLTAYCESFAAMEAVRL